MGDPLRDDAGTMAKCAGDDPSLSADTGRANRMTSPGCARAKGCGNWRSIRERDI
jgi:hypothetical protein